MFGACLVPLISVLTDRDTDRVIGTRCGKSRKWNSMYAQTTHVGGGGVPPGARCPHIEAAGGRRRTGACTGAVVLSHAVRP